MRKILAMLLSATMCTFALASCGDKPSTSVPDSSNTGAVVPNFYEVDENYLPSQDLKKFDGKVHVNMPFGQNMAGWEEIEKAYERYQPSVDIVLTNYSTSEYATILTNEVSSGSTTDWDIFQGNYINTILPLHAVDMSNNMNTKNQYANDKIWKTVLEENAYVTATTGEQTAYVLNTTSLVTAWFINQEAFVEAGIVDGNDKAKTPTTFNELVEMCQTLVDAGYRNPLGLAGNNDSINNSQFAWIARIYGDQYYRDQLDDVQPQEGDYCYSSIYDNFELDLNDPSPESHESYDVNVARKYNMILDQTSSAFVGPTSAKYKEYLTNLAKLSPYVSSSFASKSHDDVRMEFISNREDKTSPVIFLDLLGFGLAFDGYIENSTTPFSLDIFDYPPMEGEYVHTDFVRDVGGNGGYVSIMENADEKQNELNKDFAKFVLSPVGQSAFYYGLDKDGQTPEGKSLVKHVTSPSSWGDLLDTDKVKFNGLSDMNTFVTGFIYTVEAKASANTAFANNIRALYEGSKTVDTFATDWQATVHSLYLEIFDDYNHKTDCYKYPTVDPAV